MAQIIENEGGGQKGKRRAKKLSTHIDMTPMVDLACLLITFFMLTTVFSKAKVMEIILPEKTPQKDPKDAPPIPKDKTLNIIMAGDDKLYYFIGRVDAKAKPEDLPKLMKSDYSKDGIRRILLEKNMDLYLKVDSLNQGIQSGKIKISKDSVAIEIAKLKKADKKGMFVLIKADENAKYKNFVDIVDEMAVCNIARYAIVDLAPLEKEYLDKAAK